MGVVQANNELKELEAKEEKEIDRILYALSGEAASFSRDILWDYDILVHLDLIFARGELSYRMNAMRPELKKDGSVYLRHARHPLLDPAKAVPIDIELGRSFDYRPEHRRQDRELKDARPPLPDDAVRPAYPLRRPQRREHLFLGVGRHRRRAEHRAEFVDLLGAYEKHRADLGRGGRALPDPLR